MKLLIKTFLFFLLFLPLLNCSFAENTDEELFKAVEESNLKKVKQLIENGASVNSENTHGKTVLMLAAKTGTTEVAKFLVEHGADVNALDKDGNTALIFAAGEGNRDLVELLIHYGANVHAKGGRAYIIAIEKGYNQIAYLLIDLLIDWSQVENDTISSILKGGNYILIETEFEPDMLTELDEKELRLLKSTIYAKYGYIFQAKDLFEHFSRFNWYDARYKEVERFFTCSDRELVEYILWIEGKTGLHPATKEYLESLLCGEWGAGPPYYTSFSFYPDMSFEWSVPDTMITEGVRGKWKIEGKKVFVFLETAFRYRIIPDEVEERKIDNAEWELIGNLSSYRPKIRSYPVHMELRAYKYFKIKDF